MDAFGHKADKSKVNVGAMLSANNKEFYFDYKNGKYGFNTDPDRGSGTFHSFQSDLSGIRSFGYNNSNFTINCNVGDVITGFYNGAGGVPSSRFNGATLIENKTGSPYSAVLLIATSTTVNVTWSGNTIQWVCCHY